MRFLAKYTLKNFKNIQYNAIYNLKPMESIKYSEYNGGTKKRIYQNFIKAYESDFMNKTNMTPEKYIEENAIQYNALERNKEFIQEVNSTKNNFQIDNNALQKYVRQVFAGEAPDKKVDPNLISLLETWQKSAQAYLDALTKVDDLYYYANSDKQVKKLSGMPSMMFTLDKSNLTNLQNVQKYLSGLESATEKVRAKGIEASNLTDFIVAGTPLIKKSEKTSNGKTETVSGSIDKVYGSLISLMGYSLEAAVASGLQHAVGEAIQSVSMLGSAKGVNTVLYNGTPLKIRTSKTDVVMKSNEGIDINLSIKNTEFDREKHKPISVNGTGLSKILSIISNTADDADQIGGYAMWNSNKIKGSVSKLSLFLCSLTADYAVVMGGNDRIDLMVYNDRVVPLGEYYELMEQKLRMNISTSGDQKQNRALVRQALRDGKKVMPSMSIEYKV